MPIKRLLPVLSVGMLAITAWPGQAQPGAPAVLDMSALSERLDEWEQLAYHGSPETARYALYQLRRRPLLIASWRPLEPGRSTLDRAGAREVAAAVLEEAYPPSDEELYEGTHRGHRLWTYRPESPGSVVESVLAMWACPVTQRLFTVQMSIDRALETDPRWLDTLEEIRESIACHGPVIAPATEWMSRSQVVLHDRLHLGFRLPEDWTSGLLDAGTTRQSGSLWATSRELVGMILLQRRDDRSGSLLDFLRTTVDLIPVALARTGRTIQVLPGQEERVGEEWRIRGVFRVEDPEWSWVGGEHRFALVAFTARGEQHALLASWLATTNIRGAPVELALPWEMVESLLERVAGSYYP